ncbi:hypothetical protein [Nonomuraea wenchangensis]|uniref:Uncharacterized protein n=1 Tax=Nonomuraea wenchangensis TaxID=568860 RepID=A0A1I0EP82_9ACTN|nr:hypothetical protein [Nonomuraea wenchangensis]SET47101.1 hypothetical protein SAMN05421811_103142 [Nonomuraea wenchangensis]
MTIDPFTTPAEAQCEGLARQARDFFALAMTPTDLVGHEYGQNYRLTYENGVQAVRDALVGQGHATLAVNANLDRIATALETLAAAPSAIAEISRRIDHLTATLDQGVEFADSAAAAADATASAVQDLAEFANRPRWWQWRRRRSVSAIDEANA